MRAIVTDKPQIIAHFRNGHRAFGDGDQLAARNPQRTLRIKHQAATNQRPEKSAPIHTLHLIALAFICASSLFAQPYIDVPTQTKRFEHTHASTSTVGGQGGQLDNTAVKTANKQGSTGTKFSMATGAFVTGNCRTTDASGNEVDSGGTCGGTSIPTLSPTEFLQGTPNVSSAAMRSQPLTYYLTSDYNFPAQTPAGTLSAGIAATITLTPCPLGVAGADANHYYRISAGTGTSETVIGTGGSCTSGASSGTLIFTPANNHGGSWTITSASGGLREAILRSGGNARILLPANTTLSVSGTNGLVIDQSNISIIGYGYGSVIQALANQSLDVVIRASAADGLQLLNFTVDGNRSSAGTNPTFGTDINCGTPAVGGCSHVTMQGLQVKNSALFGILVNDSSTDIELSRNYIHDNGGVTDSSGSGQGIYIYWVTASGNMLSTNLRIYDNYLSDNHNTITNAHTGGAIAFKAADIKVVHNYCVNNFNNGGQIVYSMGPLGSDDSQNGPALVEGNTIISGSTALDTNPSGIESDAGRLTVNVNYIFGGKRSIALEGNPGGSGGFGATDNVVVNNTLVGAELYCVGFINAGGAVRGTVYVGNRCAQSAAGLVLDSATAATIASANIFLDVTTAIDDSSTYGIFLSGNYPNAANLQYKTVASADSIDMRCGQVATVSGSTTIRFIIFKSDQAGTNGAGCSVSLIPAAGATWQLGSTGNISTAITSVSAGRPITLISDGVLFNPITSATSLPTVGKLQYLRGNAYTAAIEGAAFPFLIAADYNFTPQAPGGSISAGVTTLTLTPCPLGVNGGDIGHYVYISGGTGTAEAVLITSGTCASGATTGTIVFTAANTHSGAFTVSSASGGIVEAMQILPNTGGQIKAPCGTVNIYQTLIIGRATATAQSTINAIGLIGCGSGRAVDIAIPIAGGTSLVWGGPAGGTVVKVYGPIGNVEIRDLMINGNAGGADIGLDIVHSYLSNYYNLNITGWNAIGVRSMAVDYNFSLMVAGNNSNRFNTVEVSGGYGGAANIACVFGQAAANTLSSFDFASNYISNTACLGGSGTGAHIRFADNNTFIMSSFNGDVTALKFIAIAATGFPTSNVFIQCPILNSLTATAAFASVTPNFFYPLTTGEYAQNLTTISPYAAGVDSLGHYFGVQATATLVRTCEIVIGDPGSGSPVLANDNDSPAVCVNDTSQTMTITAVKCYADAGSPTVTPIIHGGGGTSILSGALTCGTASYASGTLNGTPTEVAGATIDGNITAAGGTARYVVIRVSRTLPLQ